MVARVSLASECSVRVMELLKMAARVGSGGELGEVGLLGGVLEGGCGSRRPWCPLRRLRRRRSGRR